MKLPRDWPSYAGAAVAVSAIAALLVAHRRGLFFQPSPAQPSRPPPPRAWLLLQGETIALERGVRYRACLDVPGLVPNGIVANAIPAKALERGFRDVIVHRTQPAVWPVVDCDLWVEATWDREREALERPGAVDLAWREASG